MITYDELTLNTRVKIEAPIKLPHKQTYKKPVTGVVVFRGHLKDPWTGQQSSRCIWVKTNKEIISVSETLVERGYVTIVK